MSDLLNNTITTNNSNNNTDDYDDDDDDNSNNNTNNNSNNNSNNNNNNNNNNDDNNNNNNNNTSNNNYYYYNNNDDDRNTHSTHDDASGYKKKVGTLRESLLKKFHIEPTEMVSTPTIHHVTSKWSPTSKGFATFKVKHQQVVDDYKNVPMNTTQKKVTTPSSLRVTLL